VLTPSFAILPHKIQSFRDYLKTFVDAARFSACFSELREVVRPP